jgi:hypothetical protein
MHDCARAEKGIEGTSTYRLQPWVAMTSAEIFPTQTHWI